MSYSSPSIHLPVVKQTRELVKFPDAEALRQRLHTPYQLSTPMKYPPSTSLPFRDYPKHPGQSPKTSLIQSPSILLHPSRTLRSYSGLCSLHIFAASTFAGLSSFGSANMLITEMRIFSTLWIGDHRSEACS